MITEEDKEYLKNLYYNYKSGFNNSTLPKIDYSKFKPKELIYIFQEDDDIEDFIYIIKFYSDKKIVVELSANHNLYSFNGVCKEKFYIINNKLEGRRKKYYMGKDRKITEKYYVNNIKQGQYYHYFYGNEKRIKKVGMYVNNIKQGLCKKYYKPEHKSGLFEEFYYKDGIKHGLYKKFCDFHTNTIRSKGYYIDGKREGIFLNYFYPNEDNNGENKITINKHLKNKILYSNDKIYILHEYKRNGRMWKTIIFDGYQNKNYENGHFEHIQLYQKYYDHIFKTEQNWYKFCSEVEKQIIDVIYYYKNKLSFKL